MRRKARTDANHTEIVQAMRSCGWTVFDMSRAGNGFPDVLAARRGIVKLVEIKDGAKSPSRRKLTKDEALVHAAMAAAGVPVVIVETIEQATRL